MKYKNIEELSYSYFLKNKDIERWALIDFIYEYIPDFDSKMQTRVTNFLLRNGIRSIRDLYKTDIEDIKKFRNCGSKTILYITELKNIIDDLIEES